MSKLKDAVTNALAHMKSIGDSERSEWSELTFDIGGTVSFRVTKKSDYDRTLAEDDYIGTILFDKFRSQRPREFDGRARRLNLRSDCLWWQPPADVTELEQIENLWNHLREFYQDEWCYLGIIVEVKSVPCPCCGEQKIKEDAIWGVESNDENNIMELATELLSNLTQK